MFVVGDDAPALGRREEVDRVEFADSDAGVVGIIKELHKSGQTIIMVTHEDEYAALADRIITLDDGRIVSEKDN